MNRNEKNSHPGWAVYFSDGTWLGGPHGWRRYDDAFYADAFESEQEAQECLEMAKEHLDKDTPPATIVPAWQHLCERLQLENTTLQKANKVSIEDVDDIILDLENSVASLKRMIE